MAATPVSLHPHVNNRKSGRVRDRSSLDRAADASVPDLHPFLDRLAILVDGQGLFNVQGWRPRISGGQEWFVLAPTYSHQILDRPRLADKIRSIPLPGGRTIHDDGNLLAVFGREDVVQESRLACAQISCRPS